MVEREHGAGRPMPRPDKGVPFAEALNEVTREHHGALAALAVLPLLGLLAISHELRRRQAEPEPRPASAAPPPASRG